MKVKQLLATTTIFLMSIISYTAMAQAGTVCGVTIKYKGAMTPSSSLSENDALVSVNGRYRLRYDRSVGHVIEEVLNSANCQVKQVYSFAGIIAGEYIDSKAKNQSPSFNYESNGDILLIYPRSLGRFSRHAASSDKHRDAPKVNIVGKSTKLELTNDGILRLVNNSGQVIWGTTPAVDANGIAKKYKGYMTPGSFMAEHEALVSANGRYQFRNNGGSYIIEEVLNSNTGQFKQVYDFSLVAQLRPPHLHPFNEGKRGFSYTNDGDIVYIPNMSVGVFSFTSKNPSNHRDSPKVDVRNKSTKLELTNDGILRLVNNSGQVIWTTTSESAKPASAPAASNSVYNKIMAMKGKYPQGMTWTDDNRDKPGSGFTGCWAFSNILMDAAFGEKRTERKYTNFNEIRIGDMVRVNNNTHSMIVIAKDNNQFTFAEGNYSGKINWGRTMTIAELKNTFDFGYTNYP